MEKCEWYEPPKEEPQIVKTLTVGDGARIGFSDVTICKECFLSNFWGEAEESDWDEIELPTYLTIMEEKRVIYEAEEERKKQVKMWLEKNKNVVRNPSGKF